ncbi:MAG: maleylpyruvate isomerase N-terminal domain-containing protein [Acidimicrobiales bacterium]|jgi:hypothetical protein|nr:maleylpyruvate isomerase N-terminal domain-containing protein [Acidimicrobiales bacterium]MDP6298348.1 maleylpyruvate isomerase N-terminal domain-containing protein [Acidimicrobiales bacterium]HJM28270.1 maleylpyruvate isomerase N-terminal domain-containing protein [Acidimicrobiales bacterium]HJM97742.1 maleylpyruvate isomerase N-terminal domain-containing protein [Acidimicrobiales bacterium]
MSSQAVEALKKIHIEVEKVIQSMQDKDWELQSLCEGWRVQEVFAHMSSNMKEAINPTPAPETQTEPESLKAEEAMEALVAPRRDWTAQDLLDEYAQYLEDWIGWMSTLQEEPTASTKIPLADLGTYPMHMMANAFAFDHYCHLYIDILAPEGPLSIELDPPSDDMIRPGIEWMIAGMPQMQAEELASVITQPLELELTGPGGGTWTIQPASDDGMVIVSPRANLGSNATIASTAHNFVSWGTKRSDWRSSCTIDGDEIYATKVLDTLNII